MKFGNMRVRTQFKIGMGIILLLAVMLAALAWVRTDRLQLRTKRLYEHPLTVRRAIDQISSNVLFMHRDMRDLVIAENEDERQSLIRNIDAREADVVRRFDILYARYLGPESDIDEAYVAFVHWKAIRNETIRLLRTDGSVEALMRLKAGGVDGGHVEKIFENIERISTFALNKADQFYREAEEVNNAVNRQLAIMVVVILLLSLIISWTLLRNIRKPLMELLSAVERFRGGDHEARSHYASADEFGILSDGFNALAETIQSEFRSRESASRIAGAMLREENLRSFCRELLKGLLEHTGSQIGAVYLLNDRKTTFDHFESIGLVPEGRASFSATEFEGEFGAALATGQIRYIADIPEDSRFTFATVAGEFQPRSIITIPVPGAEGITAMISLAGVRVHSASASRLLNDVWSLVVARMNGVLASEKIRAFAEEIERQNEELQVQQEELEVQAEELQTQTEELRTQAEELQTRNVMLERQRLAVEEAGRLKSQFLSNMSHELRTPLNSVMALSRVLMMQAGTKLDEEEVRYLEIIERNGKNLLMLINDILDLSKIEAGRMDVHPNPFSLARTVENIVESITPLAVEKGIEIHENIPKDLPLVESDEIKVSQVLQNLLGNAVKFTDTGRVTVSVRTHREEVSVSVADTGIGITESDLPYIFDEFRQVDGSPSRKYEGTGLGLAIARKTAGLLGGEIAVESVRGKGSTFTLILPLTWRGTAPVHKPIILDPPSGVRPEERTVLVVDDEPETAATISNYLLQEGYNTLTATSGEEALRLAVRERPFVIVLDIVMPDMDGWEVLQSLKDDPQTRDMPVIAVSAEEDGDTAFALGAVGHVAKPVSKQVLISEIRRIEKPRARSILLVEDNEAVIVQVRAMLESAGYEVHVARGGQEAVDHVSHTIPDGIVLDLMMPDVDGFAVLEKIRGTQATEKIPVLILTAKDLTPEDLKFLSANHVRQLVQKGDVDRERLLSKVKSLFEWKENPSIHEPEPASAQTSNPSRVPTASESSSASPRGSRSATVLIVEDNPDNMVTIKAVLGNRYRILEATDGKTGLRMVLESRPNLVLLDMALPEMDGLTVVRRIRENTESASVPVIAMTARAMKGSREEMLEAGCDDYISKPIDPVEVLAKIDSRLES